MNKINSLGIDFYFKNGQPSHFIIVNKFGNENDQINISIQNLSLIFNKKIEVIDSQKFIFSN